MNMRNAFRVAAALGGLTTFLFSVGAPMSHGG